MDATDTIIEATLEDRGGTFLRDGTSVLRGWVVAAAAGSAAIVRVGDTDGLRAAITDVLSAADTVGTWLDTATDLIHIDPVEVVARRAVAIRKGIERQQLAIFHLDTFTEVRL